MSEFIKKMTDDNYKEIIGGSRAVLVDAYADWCGPCKALAPILEELAYERQELVTIAKLNIDENEMLADALKVSSIPYLVLFIDGKIVDASVGYKPKDAIDAWIKDKVNIETK